MRIAFDGQTFTNQTFGGISRYFCLLSSELVKLNQDVHIYAGFHRNNYLTNMPKDRVSGFHLNSYPPKTSRLFRLLNHAYSELLLTQGKPDIIHETYYSAKPVVSSCTARVTTVYDMIHEIYPSDFLKRDRTTFWKKKTFDRVDHIISISNSTKNDLVNILGIEESKISVVHLGVDISVFDKKKHASYLFSKPYVLYVGGRAGYKNFDNFIRAFSLSSKLVNDFNVVAFGGGAFSARELLLARELGLKDDQLIQIGGGDEVLSSLYSNAEILVFPSLYEGFGLPPLEAMASGCPVVASNTSSMPEVIGNAGLLFDPASLDDISNTIESVVYSEALKANLREKGYDNIKDFSWQSCAEKTLGIYNKIVGAK